MRLYETRNFLFLSDLPPPAANLYTSCLDEMHDQLCKAFAIKDRDRVWLGGKVPVIAFARGEYFAAFEEEFFKNRVDPRSAQGLAHQESTGQVVVSCHCGNDPYYFAAVLVHETTHGFVHRYKSAAAHPQLAQRGNGRMGGHERGAQGPGGQTQGESRHVGDASDRDPGRRLLHRRAHRRRPIRHRHRAWSTTFSAPIPRDSAP